MIATLFLCLALPTALRVPAQAAVAAASSREIEAKVALESSIERRLEAVLKEVLGTQDVVVIVNADMLSDTERKAVEIMPGVPPKELSAAASPLGVAPTLVRRLAATVFVDQQLRESERDLARRTVERLLGVSADSSNVTVEAAAFRHPQAQPPAPPPAFDRKAWVAPGAWLGFALLALLVLYSRFLAPLLTVLRDISAAAKDRSPSLTPVPGAEGAAPALAGAAGAPALEGPQPSREPAAKDGAHFGFIGERDLGALAFLLQRDPTSAAIVLNYLPPVLGSRFLDHLPAAVRQDIAGLMTQTRLLNKHQVNMIEEGLRERLQYLMGGESRLADILEGANAHVQTELIGALRERDPEAAGRLARRIVMLDDIALLDENDFKALSRLVTVKSLAAVLASAPELRDRVLPRLSGGVAEWLIQEVELCPSLPPETLESERRRVLTALSKAVKEGRISLRKDVEEPRPEGLDAPPAPPMTTDIVPRQEAA